MARNFGLRSARSLSRIALNPCFHTSAGRRQRGSPFLRRNDRPRCHRRLTSFRAFPVSHRRILQLLAPRGIFEPHASRREGRPRLVESTRPARGTGSHETCRGRHRAVIHHPGNIISRKSTASTDLSDFVVADVRSPAQTVELAERLQDIGVYAVADFGAAGFYSLQGGT